MARGHRSAMMIALASTPLEVPTLMFAPFLSLALVRHRGSFVTPLTAVPSTPSSSMRGGSCQRALDDDVRSPLSFSPFPPMCAALSSPRCATAGISSTPVGLPSDDIAIAAATTTTIAPSVTAFLLLHRVRPPPDSSSRSSSSTPPKSQLHLQSVRVMAMAVAVATRCPPSLKLTYSTSLVDKSMTAADDSSGCRSTRHCPL